MVGYSTNRFILAVERFHHKAVCLSVQWETFGKGKNTKHSAELTCTLGEKH